MGTKRCPPLSSMLSVKRKKYNMNERLQNYARAILKENLMQLPESNQLLFKYMYSHKNIDADINDVIDNMSEEKLDWVMQQVQRTLDKNK